MDERRLPASGRGARQTVLVTGQARALLRRVPLRLFGQRVRESDGVVVATTLEDPAVVGRRSCAAVPGLDADRVALVDCRARNPEAPSRGQTLRWEVPSPVAFRAVAAAVRAAGEELTARGAERVHVLFDALTAQFRLADPVCVARHAREVATTVAAGRGIGAFALEPSAVTDREFARLKRLADVHVAVRRTVAGPQVRWSGPADRSDGWVPLASTELGLDAPGKSVG